jgi:hypothetical protein
LNDRAVRWAGLAGIVFVVLIIISIVSSGSMPAADDPAEKIRTFFVDHRGGLLAANFAGLLATPFVLWFGVGLREIVRGDRIARAQGTASLAGLLVTAPMAMVGGALQVAAVYVDGAAAKTNPDTLRLLFNAQALAFGATASGIIVFVAGAGLAIRRTGALPAYTTWLAVLAVVGNVVALFSTLGAGASAVGLAGVATFALFILVSGITMAAGRATPVPET